MCHQGTCWYMFINLHYHHYTMDIINIMELVLAALLACPGTPSRSSGSQSWVLPVCLYPKRCAHLPPYFVTFFQCQKPCISNSNIIILLLPIVWCATWLALNFHAPSHNTMASTPTHDTCPYNIQGEWGAL